MTDTSYFVHRKLVTIFSKLAFTQLVLKHYSTRYIDL